MCSVNKCSCRPNFVVAALSYSLLLLWLAAFPYSISMFCLILAGVSAQPSIVITVTGNEQGMMWWRAAGVRWKWWLHNQQTRQILNEQVEQSFCLLSLIPFSVPFDLFIHLIVIFFFCCNNFLFIFFVCFLKRVWKKTLLKNQLKKTCGNVWSWISVLPAALSCCLRANQVCKLSSSWSLGFGEVSGLWADVPTLAVLCL